MKSNNIKNDKFGKIIINLIALMLIVVVALGIVKTYPKINESANNYEENYFESYDMARILSEASYTLYYDNLKNDSESKVTPYDVLIEKSDVYAYNDQEVGSFNNEVGSWDYKLKRYIKNLKITAIDDKNKEIEYSTMDKEIKFLENGELDLSSLEKDKYQFYLLVKYNENGVIEIKDLIGAQNVLLEARLLDMQSNIYYNKRLGLTPIKNMTYIFAVPKEIQTNDTIYRGIDDAENYGYYMGITRVVVLSVLLIMICALLIPYKRSREIIGFKSICKIPFEVIGIIIWGVSTGVFAFVILELSYFIRSGESVLGKNIGIAAENIWLVNFMFWVVVLAVAFNIVLVIKYIFNTGLRKYFKEQSLIGKGISYIVRLIKNLGRSIKRTFNTLSSIDLSQKNNKVILKILAVNALILSGLCAIWFFGIFGVIIYSVCLFVLIRKNLDKISNQYKIFKEATNKIAEGNLDVKIKEEIGIFEPFKEDLERIQSGFKKAVEEEIKSEKMKTELISNVSHDLKTPLTSIITYVDLLKDESLSSEKRAQYLETLDRKSQRLQFLIEDLFEMSKASSGNISLNIEEVDVVSLMKQTLLELEDKVNESSLLVKKNFTSSKVILKLDSQRTFRVFENLVLNITKYAMNGTRVYIDILENESNVEIVLRNIAAEEITFNVENIVERFVRGDESRNTEGSGLGLAIAKSFVELQGGSFNINVDGDLFKVSIVFNK
ncbi:sensor histidine kinase [Clostridium sp.]|uniref:sensor histidine kinase n=1 Tax=Clostridium sp. TaxID=1506 RepID=UPI003F2ABA64